MFLQPPACARSLCRSKYLCQMMKSTADCLTNELLIQQLLIPLACHQVTICAQQFQAAYSLIFSRRTDLFARERVLGSIGGVSAATAWESEWFLP